MSVSHKYKLLSVRTKLLKNEIELIEDTIQTAEREFISELRNRHTQEDPASASRENEELKAQSPPKTENPGPQLDQIKSAEKSRSPENIKKTYRKIAFMSHPDKLLGLSEYEISHKKDLFEKAKKALEDNDYCAIIEIASELGIEPPMISKADVEIIKKNIKKLEKKIKAKKESIAWVWYHSEEEKRRTIMDRYIEKLKEINLRS